MGAKSDHSEEALRAYVSQRQNRDDVLFLGIFTWNHREHIGNVKYEPVDAANGYAVVGIFIGEPAYRGRGVATEVLRHSAAWLRRMRGIGEIMLGVASEHSAAIRAFEKAGFKREPTDRITLLPGAISLVLHLDHP